QFLRRGDFFALVDPDLGEDVRHQAAAVFDTLINRSSRPSASPESTEWAAACSPSVRSFAVPATTSAAAAFKRATSRKADGLPLRTSSTALAFVSASPPRRASGLTLCRPNCSGEISNALIWPPSKATTVVGPDVVISSRPSEPCTTQTF